MVFNESYITSEECRNMFAEWKDCDSLKRREKIKI